ARRGERLDHALQPVHARALDEEPHVRGFRAERRSERRGERRRLGEPLAPRPEALHRPRRERTGRVEPLEAVHARELADVAVRTPKLTTRAGVSERQSGANSSSALMTAVAPFARPATISPSARATPSRLPKPSRCSAPALVMRPIVGRAMSTRAATSPG